MKTFYSSNQELLEVLANNGIELVCNDNMEIIVSDEDAAKIGEIVEKYAPAASGDYCIEDMKTYKVYFDNNNETVLVKETETIESAKAFIEECVKGATLDELGGCTDDVFYSSHVGHLEVYENGPLVEDEDGDMICEDPVYTSPAFYTDSAHI